MCIQVEQKQQEHFTLKQIRLLWININTVINNHTTEHAHKLTNISPFSPHEFPINDLNLNAKPERISRELIV